MTAQSLPSTVVPLILAMTGLSQDRVIDCYNDDAWVCPQPSSFFAPYCSGTDEVLEFEVCEAPYYGCDSLDGCGPPADPPCCCEPRVVALAITGECLTYSDVRVSACYAKEVFGISLSNFSVGEYHVVIDDTFNDGWDCGEHCLPGEGTQSCTYCKTYLRHCEGPICFECSGLNRLSVDRDSLQADGFDHTIVEADELPCSERIRWTIVGDTLGASVQPVGGRFARVVAGNRPGAIIIRAADDFSDCNAAQCFVQMPLEIRPCGSCAPTCEAGGADVGFGTDMSGTSKYLCTGATSGEVVTTGDMNNLGGIRVAFNLGGSVEGLPVGALRMLGAYGGSPPAPRVRDLRYDVARDDVSVYRPDAETDPFAAIKQIKTPGILVDIDSNGPNATAFGIRFYYRDQFTAEEWNSEEVPINEFSTAPFVYWEVGQSGPSFLTLWKKRYTSDAWVNLARYEYTSTVAREITLTTSVPDGSGGWTPLSVETESWVGTTRTYVRKDAPDLGTIAVQIVEQYSSLPEDAARFPSLLRREVSTGEGDPLVTQFAFYNATDDGPQHAGKYGYLKWVKLPDASWESYDYAPGDERPIMISRPIPDGGVVPGYPDPAFHQTTLIEYAFGVHIEPRPTSVTETVPDSGGGYSIVAKRFFEYGGSSGPPTRDVEVATEPNATPGSSTNLLTVITYDAPENPLRFAERVSHINFGDGTSVDYEWQAGEFQIDENVPPTPSFVPGAGGQARRVTMTEKIAPFGMPVAGKSRRSVVVLDRVGRTVWQQEFACTGEDTFTLMDSVVRVFDELPVDDDPSATVYHIDGTISTVQHDLCQCGSATVTDRTGASTSSEYDAIGRLIAQTQFDGPQGNIVTTYAYGTANGLRSVTAVTTGGSDTVRTRTEYDLAGRVRFVRQGPVGAELVTEYQYSPGGTQVTVIDPGGATSVTDHYRDGRIKSVTGSGVVEQRYEYSAAPGEQTTTVISGPTNVGAGELRYVATTTDMAGRTKRVERPGFSADPQTPVTLSTEYEYFGPEAGKPQGALKRVATSAGGTPLIAPTLYEYDELARVVRSGLDIDGDGVLNLTGSDRIVAGDTQFVQLNGMWWTQTTQSVYRTAGAADVASVVARSVFPAWLPDTPAVHGWSETVDANGNVATTKTVIDAAQKLVTTTTEYPHITGDDVSVSYNGRLVETTSHTGITTSNEYDGLGRVAHVHHPRSGLFDTIAYDDHGRIASVIDTLNHPTAYEYYGAAESGVAGRLKAVVNVDGKRTRYDYDLLGRVTHVWGEVPHPTFVEYDAYGQLNRLHTYRTGTSWAAADWPAGAGDGDVTTWVLDRATGLPTSKEYNDDTTVSFTYTPDGLPKVRTWARGVSTTYSYFGEQQSEDKTRLLKNVSYSDGTPSVALTYDRLGRPDTVVDALGTRTYSYDAALALIGESISGASNGYYDKLLTRTYDATGFGRLNGIQVGTASDPDADYAAAYGYDAATGRLARVTGPGLPTGASADYGAFYEYELNSELLKKISVRDDQNNALTETLRAFEPNRDLVDYVENKWVPSATVVSKYDYTNDALGRRTGVALSGTAFHPTNNPAISLSYPYNDRSEVTGATRVVTGGATSSWSYSYDPAGNRVQMMEDQGTALTTSYLTNGVNQYHWTDRPAAGTKPQVRQNLDYDGDGNLVEAYVVGDVNCDGAFDSFDTDAFALAVSDPQEYAVQYPSCDILNADINGDGSVNGFDTDAFTELLTSGGNSGAVWEEYVWDGENRLVEVRPGLETPPSGSKKSTFAYDFLGRRIGKKVYNRTAGGSWSLTQDRQYVYDGWNLLLELDAAQSGSPVVRKHTWGLDLAGQNVAQPPSAVSAGSVAQPPSAVSSDAAAGLHGAGGVGGLLATHDEPGGGQPTRDFVHFYDANGNVTQLIDISSGAAAAKYEYDAFGNELVRTGTFATSNRFRFSTKYTDANTDFAGEGTDGLSYYGYRYYSPRLGRWMNRDPIGEAGGANLYGFVSNDPLDEVDIVGLFDDEAADEYMKRLERALERGNTSVLCTQGDETHAMAERGCRFALNLTGGEGKLPVFDPGPEQDSVLECADIILTVDCAAGGVQTLRYAVVKGGKVVGWLRKLPKCATVPIRSASEVCDAAGELATLAGKAESGACRSACKSRQCVEEIKVCTPTQPNTTRGWKVGDPINNLTAKGDVPTWDAVRQRYWKNEASKNAGKYSEDNLKRMKVGLAPRRFNPDTGQWESMELHHAPPQRDGGLFDVCPVWPSQHADIDPYRQLGG